MRRGQPNNWRGAGAGRVAGAISVVRPLINLILNRYHTIQKEILKYLKHYSKFHEVFII